MIAKKYLKSDYLTWVLCILVGGIAFGFGVYHLGKPSIWFDEAFSVELARQPLPTLLRIIFGPEPNMELYYLFLHAWLGLTGLLGFNPTEFVVRLPSVCFAAASTVVVLLLGKRFLGLMAGLVAAGLYLLNTLQLVYAQQTRGYSLQLLLICLAWYMLFRAVMDEGEGAASQKRWWLVYVIFSVLAIYTHLFSVLIVAAQYCALVSIWFFSTGVKRKRPERAQWMLPLLSLLAIILLSLPLVPAVLHGPKTGWLPIPKPSSIYHLFWTMTTDSFSYQVGIGLCIVLLALAIGVRWLTGRDEQRISVIKSQPAWLGFTEKQLPLVLVLACWLIIPIVLSYLISQGSTRLFSSRYLVTVLPALFLLVGAGVEALRLRPVQIALAVLLLAMAAVLTPRYYASAQVEDWNAAAHWLEPRYQNGNGLVCYDNEPEQGCQIAMEYYLHAYPGEAQFSSDSPGLFSWNTFGIVNLTEGYYRRAVEPSELARFGRQHAHIFFITGRIPDAAGDKEVHTALLWLNQHYRLVQQKMTRTVQIREYATR